MSLPGYNAQASLGQSSKSYGGRAGHDGATAGVQPARIYMSASCSAAYPGLYQHCTVRWGFANCRGSYTTYTSGAYEEEHSCD